MLRISSTDEYGYVFRLLSFRRDLEAVMIPAWDLSHTPAAFAAFVMPAPDPTVKPAWMAQEHYDTYVYPPATAAAVAVVIGAAPAAQVAYPAPPREVSIGPLQEEFDDFFWLIFQAGGHSGYPTQATFTQKIGFVFQRQPDDGYYHEFELSRLPSLFPPGVTFLNLANAHADMIVRTAKDGQVVWEWGSRHGVPASIGWAGVPCWRYVSDMKLISEDMRETLNWASYEAIRSSQSASFQDPLAAIPERREGVDAAADLLAQRQAMLDTAGRDELDPRIRARSRYTSGAGLADLFAQYQQQQQRRRQPDAGGS